MGCWSWNKSQETTPEVRASIGTRSSARSSELSSIRDARTQSTAARRLGKQALGSPVGTKVDRSAINWTTVNWTTIIWTTIIWSTIVWTSVASTPAAWSAVAPATDPFHNIGVKECAACHSAPSPIYRALGITRFARLVEAKEWLENDKHAYAYQLIRRDLSPEELKREDRRSNKLSREITDRLQWDDGDGNFERKCLTCHVGSDAARTPSAIEIRFGVQCESCHGPGSEYVRTEHHQQVSWRAKTPEQKEALGMWDLTSPSTAAAICLSCHLGNVEQSRFITHAMYAAGHPILPPFDLQSFLDAMPPHWKTLQEKPAFERQAEYNRVHFDIAGNTDEIQEAILGSYDKSRRSMMGGLVANDLGIRTLHQVAQTPDLWGDYALYNCTGCHQELKKNLAPVLIRARIPGRPFPADWLTFESTSIHASGLSKQSILEKEMSDLFNATPFGDAQRLAPMKDRHLQSLASRFQDRRKAERQPMTKRDVQQWLASLLASRIHALDDYAVAKQTGWMVCVAIDELVAHREIPSSAVVGYQKELRELLHLEIAVPQRQSVITGQAAVLETARTYDPVRCRELIVALVKHSQE